MDNAFGRLDEEGTVYVRMPDGSEHVVGQWAAGKPEDGLAYYRRRYDDIVVEVDLTRQRLKSGNASPDQAEGVIAKTTQALAEPTFVGDLKALGGKIEALTVLVATRREEIAEAKAQAKAEAALRREAIAEEAEQLATSEQWKVAGQRFRDLLDEWKGLPRFDKAAEQAQWERFSAARSSFDKARRHHFAELDAERSEAAKVKQDLVRRAQELSSSTDWGPTSRAYRELMDEWKAAPRAGREQDDRLWSEFRAAQDVFFFARNEVNAERTAQEQRNLEAKQAILVKAEALTPGDDSRAARARLSELMEEWDRIGFVPRSDRPALERRLRAVEDKMRAAERESWRRSDPAAKARAESTVESFRASVAKLEKRLAAAEAGGDERKVVELTQSIESSRALLAAAESAAADFS